MGRESRTNVRIRSWPMMAMGVAALCLFIGPSCIGDVMATLPPPEPTDDDDDVVAGDDDDDDSAEQVPGGGDEADWLFGTDAVHQIEIILESDALAELNTWPGAFEYDLPYDFVHGNLLIDGELIEDVGVRLKGRWGSYRGMGGKAAFKIDLNRYVSGQRFHGLEKLTLNNMIVDCTMSREVLAFSVYEAMGLPTPRAGYSWVTVNGVPYGLYLLVESIDDRFVDRVYTDTTGNLYEPEYIVYPDYNYTLVDFDQQSQHLFDLEEGTDVGLADVYAVTAALDGASGNEFTPEVGPLVDLDMLTRLMAVEQWVGQVDGYSMNINNYFVYFDPGDGKAEIIPWDLDYSFIHSQDWGSSWNNPNGRLAGSCLDDVECRGLFYDHAQTTGALADDLELQDRFDEIKELIHDYQNEDPRQECSSSYIIYYSDIVEDWISYRTWEVEQFWGF